MSSATQNIARSLTTRMNRKISDADTAAHGLMSRAFSTRKVQEKVPFRPEISLPIELLSATNPLAFTAPDIHPQNNPGSAASGATSKFSYNPAQTLASTASSGSLRSENSVPGLSTSSSVASPSPLQTPVNERIEQDFNGEKRLTSLAEIDAGASIAARIEESISLEPESSFDEDKLALEAPTVPKRAPSHTKKAHQGLHRQRSLSRIGARTPSVGRTVSGTSNTMSENDSRKSSSSANSNGHLSTHSLEKDANGVKVVRNSIDIFSSGEASKDHPFGAELAKLDEMAEEFSPTKDRHNDESKAEPKQELRRERSFKALRRGLSRKEKKQPEAEKTEDEPGVNALQRQRSFKVLRRDPSTKELKAEGEATLPKLEKAAQPVQEDSISVPRREPSRRRAPTVTRDEVPNFSAPRPVSKSRSTTRARPTKIAVPPSEPTIWDEESEYLNKHGLKTYSAEDYMAEIGSPYASTFSSSQSGWL